MEKVDTIQILQRIKTYYPDFYSDTETIDNWHEVLKEYPFLEIDGKLNDYLRTDNDKPPRLNHLTNGVQTLAQKYNKVNDDFVWCNLCGKRMRFREYEKHYARCLQVQTLWRKVKQLGKEIPREEIEQYGDDILNKLEEKYIEKTFNVSDIVKTF